MTDARWDTYRSEIANLDFPDITVTGTRPVTPVGARFTIGPADSAFVPVWGPLAARIGAKSSFRYMYMFAGTVDGRRAYAYKHVDTREYLYLDASGREVI